MMVSKWASARFATVLLSTTVLLPAEPDVGPAREIQFRVNVNRIQTVSSSGDSANVFGTASQEADIIRKINTIWAQAGVEVVFSPVRRFVSDFAYDNNGQSRNASRPSNDLGRILTNSPSVTSSSAVDIDMFFVDIVPAFSGLGPNQAAGFARVDRPGTAVFVGSTLLTFSNGRTVVASVLAHEIGHNLGLSHTTTGGANLMSPRGTTEDLTNNQRLTILDDATRGGRPLIDGFDLLMPIEDMTNFEAFLVENSLSDDPQDDADSDGVANLLEFAIGSDPRVPSGLPRLTPTNNGARWSIPKSSAAVGDGLFYEIEVSSDLRNFVPAGQSGSQSTVTTDNASQLVVDLQGDGPRFAMLNVDLPGLSSIRTLDEGDDDLGDSEGCQCCGDCGVRTLVPPDELLEPAE